MATTNLIIADEDSPFADRAAEWVVAFIERTVSKQGFCRLALSGGATPMPVFVRLADPVLTKGLSWSKLEIFFCDERCVPPDHPESNYRRIRETLLDKIAIPPSHVHRIKGENPDHEAAALEYDHGLPEKLDLLLLGMGSDGHTASLFPHSSVLDESLRRVVPVIGDKPPPYRITVTPRVIAEARSLLVLVSGESKAVMIARALKGPFAAKEIPAQLALLGTWILDRSAARNLD